MLLTLYGYILKDLLKMLAIATVVLVVVISFGAAIKPLKDGLLTPETLPTFVMVTAPTMLMYALPFSLAFAVTMVYTRMTADGEITACSAGGLSYISIFKPVAILGGVMAVVMFILANWVLPSLHEVAREMVQKDTIRIMMYEFSQGRSMRIGDSVIYAREAQSAPPPHIEGSPLQPTELILLRNATFGKVEPKTGRVTSDHTASSADILVFRDEGRSWIQFRLRNPIYHTDPGDLSPAVGMQADKMEMLPTIELPSTVSDDPRRMNWGELMEVASQADHHPALRVQREMLAGAIAMARIRLTMIQELMRSAALYGTGAPDEPAPGGLVLRSSREGETFVISAPKVEVYAEVIIPQAMPGKPVRIESVENGQLVRRYEATGHVTLALEYENEIVEPKIVLTMKDVIISDPRQSNRSTERTDLKLSRLWWREPVIGSMSNLGGSQLMALGKAIQVSPTVRAATEFLRDRTDRLIRRAVLEFHLRGAYSFNLFLAALFAGLLSVRLRGRLSLVVFFYAFMVVLAGILLTYNGERFGRSHPITLGMALMWLSSLLTAGGIGLLYAKVARN